MGIKALWIVFGAAAFYALAAALVPVLIVVLHGSGVEISHETATNVTRLIALLASALGGALGVRHAQKMEARRQDG
jgi:hypothetical protein